VPRDQPGALIHDPDEAVRQALALAQRGVQSLCVHGDNPQALDFVRALRAGLGQAGFEFRAFA
jgi:5-oxoprolinase (ATP-hydrolysing) subunit A